jgi:hypothetical protein
MGKAAIPVLAVYVLALVFGLHQVGELDGVLKGGPPKGLLRVPVVQGWIVLLVLAQAALLWRVDRDSPWLRLRARRKWHLAVWAAALCAGLLTAGFLASVAVIVFGDNALGPMGLLVDWAGRVARADWVNRWVPPLAFLGFLVGMWVGWWVVLSRAGRGRAEGEREGVTARWARWILAGSVAELLVAVPAHLISRKRDDCCAPFLSLWGIATGWAVFLLAAGPVAAWWLRRRIEGKANRAKIRAFPGEDPPRG